MVHDEEMSAARDAMFRATDALAHAKIDFTRLAEDAPEREVAIANVTRLSGALDDALNAYRAAVAAK